MVMDVMLSWENQKDDERQGKKPIPKLTQQEMMDMLNKARSE
jgi:hypothetical protein